MSPANDGLSVEIQAKKVEVDCEACGRAGRDGENSVGAGIADSIGRADISAGDLASTISLTLTAFDTRHYQDLIRTRAATIRRVVRALKPAL